MTGPFQAIGEAFQTIGQALAAAEANEGRCRIMVLAEQARNDPATSEGGA